MSTREQVLRLREALSSRQNILNRLQEIAEELIAYYREQAGVMIQEEYGKVQTYVESNERTVTGRKELAKYNTISSTSEIIRIKGEIAALVEERDFLKFYLGGMSGNENAGNTPQ